jgi:hypothetical protein
MGTYPTKVQGKWEHKYTEPKEEIKANNQQKLNKDPMKSRFMVMQW